MKERPDFYYRGPETSPDDAHRLIQTGLQTASERLWIPNESPHSFSFNRSAAGRELGAYLPPNDMREFPLTTIAIERPSHRMLGAMSRVLAFHGEGDVVAIKILSPEEAGLLQHPGTMLAVMNHKDKEPCFTGTLDYNMFLHFMDESGLCEEASRSQRIGRWISDSVAKYLDDQASIYEAGGYRHPPFSGW